MLIGLIIAVVVGTLGGVGWFYYERSKVRKQLGYELTYEKLPIRTSVKTENNFTRPETSGRSVSYGTVTPEFVREIISRPLPKGFTPPTRPAEPKPFTHRARKPEANPTPYVPSTSTDDISILTTAYVVTSMFDSSPSPSYDSSDCGSSSNSDSSCGSD